MNDRTDMGTRGDRERKKYWNLNKKQNTVFLAKTQRRKERIKLGRSISSRFEFN
jgi:hypothetical protein